MIKKHLEASMLVHRILRSPDFQKQTFYIQYFIGIIFFLSSLGKLNDLSAFQSSLHHYLLIPERWVNFLVIAFPLVEMSLALGLWSGRFIKSFLVLSSGLFTLFIILQLQAWRSGYAGDCGCFGPGVRASHPLSLAIDLFLLVLCIRVIWFSRKEKYDASVIKPFAPSKLAVSLFYSLLFISAGFAFEPIWSQSLGLTEKDPAAHADAVMFYDKGCSYCRSASTILEEFERDNPLIHIVWIESQDRNAYKIRMRYDQRFGVDSNHRGAIPAFFGGSGAVFRGRFTLARLRQATQKSLLER